MPDRSEAEFIKPSWEHSSLSNFVEPAGLDLEVRFKAVSTAKSHLMLSRLNGPEHAKDSYGISRIEVPMYLGRIEYTTF